MNSIKVLSKGRIKTFCGDYPENSRKSENSLTTNHTSGGLLPSSLSIFTNFLTKWVVQINAGNFSKNLESIIYHGWYYAKGWNWRKFI